MKEQWKKTGFWSLMALLSMMLSFAMPTLFFVMGYCLINSMCYLFSAVVVTFDRKARAYRYYVGAYLLTIFLIVIDCAKNITAAEQGSMETAVYVMTALFIVPVMLLTARDKYKKGKKEYEADMLLNGGDIYE